MESTFVSSSTDLAHPRHASRGTLSVLPHLEDSSQAAVQTVTQGFEEANKRDGRFPGVLSIAEGVLLLLFVLAIFQARRRKQNKTKAVGRTPLGTLSTGPLRPRSTEGSSRSVPTHQRSTDPVTSTRSSS